jgi:hypothetical protein
MNTEKLISLKQNFTGQRFQWIKPDRPELMAKVVKCRDVDAVPDGRFFIIFDDGSKVDSTKLNSNLLMIHGDMQPLTKQEVESIYGPRVPAEPKVAPQISSTAPKVNIQPVQPAQSISSPVSEPSQATQKPNMFAMFNSEESTLTLNLQVRIPEKKLLKLMYQNAENKEQFIVELAEHLHSMINKQVVQNSIQTILAPTPLKKEKSIINLTEVDGTN